LKEKRLKFKREIPFSVTWHDPCHLGRHCGVYEAPRNLLKAIPSLKLVEMERNRDQAWCCGGGGGVRSAFFDFAQKTAKKRVYEAKVCGADSIVTSCPFCEQNLREPAKQQGLKLLDITDLVMYSLGLKETIM